MKNFTSPFDNNKILTNKQKYSTILMKNCGLDPIIFNNMQKYVYAYQKNNMKKVSSLNAIIAIPINEEEIKNNQKKPYVAEDKESYEREELNKILDDDVYYINMKNSNTTNITNGNKKMSAFEECPQLDSLIQKINNGYVNSNSLINSYKSKNDSKFFQIHDINSKKIQGKFKYKLFHKCCFPGCNRTFSSSGWLKAHLKEHLKQVENNWFSLAFRKFIYKGQINKKNYDKSKKDKNKEVDINNKKKNIFIVDK